MSTQHRAQGQEDEPKALQPRVPNCTPQHHQNQNEEHYTMMWGDTVGKKNFETFFMKNCCTIPTQNPMVEKDSNQLGQRGIAAWGGKPKFAVRTSELCTKSFVIPFDYHNHS